MAWIYFFYVNDPKCKNTDIFSVDSNTCERIRKEIKSGARTIEIFPGEASYMDKRTKRLITYSQYINLDTVHKVVIDDLN